jgi:hypothetical protein
LMGVVSLHVGSKAVSSPIIASPGCPLLPV